MMQLVIFSHQYKMTKTRKVAISKKIDFVDLASASMLAAIDTKDTSKVAREVEMAP